MTEEEKAAAAAAKEEQKAAAAAAKEQEKAAAQKLKDETAAREKAEAAAIRATGLIPVRIEVAGFKWNSHLETPVGTILGMTEGQADSAEANELGTIIK